MQKIGFWLFLGILFFLEEFSANTILESHLYSGTPFGVGKIVVQLEPYQKNKAPWEEFLLKEHSQRVFYPVYELYESAPHGLSHYNSYGITYYFLFQEQSALDISGYLVSHQQTTTLFQTTLTPKHEETPHHQLLSEWWRIYQRRMYALKKIDYYNTMVEQYHLNLLAQKLQLDKMEEPYSWSWTNNQDVDFLIGFFTGGESIRLAMQKDAILKETSASETADRPLPEGISLPPITIPSFDESTVEIETIANYVPEECFYIRFGSFQHFQWFRQLVEEWGSKTKELISFRGLDYRVNDRMKYQLALKDTFLAKILGGLLISDVAFIGTDPFFNEGATFGILFEEQKLATLEEQLYNIRQEYQKEVPSIQEQTVSISGHTVSFLSTPDNQIRSFYAIRDRYHLITNSEALVKRFYESSEGKGSLANLKEFRYARFKNPLTRKDKVFLYVSDSFFRSILSPHYRVEMTRRLRASSELDLIHLAYLTAKAEKKECDTLEKLVQHKYLPTHFLEKRADHSSLKLTENGIGNDSLRGANGSFLPILDAPIPAITPSEEREYLRFLEWYRNQWQSNKLDPITLTIQQEPTEEGEKLIVDLHIMPYAASVYQQVQQFLTPRTHEALPRVPDSLFQLQVNALGEVFFAGLFDYKLSYTIKDGGIQATSSYSSEPYYIIAKTLDEGISGWIFGSHLDLPEKGYVERYSNWYYRDGRLFISAKGKDSIEKVHKNLLFYEAERSAQVRFSLADLSQTKMAESINDYAYVHLRKISSNNIRFLYSLNQQLQISMKDCPQVAKRLLNANPYCPLGGEYLLQEKEGSSSFSSPELQYYDPYNITRYSLPLLHWFMGLEFEFSIDETSLWTHLEMHVRKKPSQEK